MLKQKKIQEMVFVTLFVVLSVISIDLSAQQLSLDKVAEISPDQLMGSYITGLDVTENGHIAVALNDLARIQIYNIEGNLENKYGRRGRGPGDFSNLTSVQLTDSVVFAMDAGPAGRIQAFKRGDPEDYRTYQIPRSSKGSPNKMWLLKSGDFLIEFKPAFSSLSIQRELTSSFEIKPISDDRDLIFIFENHINEAFIDQSDGGFSVSSMPYGRKNFITPSGDFIFHNWSDEFAFTKINLNSFEKTSIEPDKLPDRKTITKEGYRKYILGELGISPKENISRDNIDDLLKSLSTDASSRLKLRTIHAKLNNRDRLHDFYPAYRWIVGDEDRICYGMYTDDLMVNKVNCMDEQGTLIWENEISSDIEMLSNNGDYMAGLRQLDDGLQSVVVYKIEKVD